MKDRELLELAAKALGSHEVWTDIDGNRYCGDPERPWNPLTDDGDALRLAVRLEFQLRLRHNENEVSVYGVPEGRIDEGVRGDPLAATRRAIVRAAAEIGKARP